MPYESTARRAERGAFQESLDRAPDSPYVRGVLAFGRERDLDLTMLGVVHSELTYGIDLRRWGGESNREVRVAIDQARVAVKAAYELLIERYWAVLEEQKLQDGAEAADA